MTLITVSNASDILQAIQQAVTGTHILVTGPAQTIHLEQELVLRSTQSVTIEAERPLTFTGHQFAVSQCADVRLRNLRFSSSEGRSLQDRARRLITNRLGGTRSLLIADSSYVTVEHCSIRQSTDDDTDITGECHTICIRDCLIHGGDGPERKAVRVGVRPGQPYVNLPDYFTMERCLIVGVDYRAPKLHGGIHDITNNLIVGQSQGSEWIEFLGDCVGNYFLPSPACKQGIVVCSGARMVTTGVWMQGNMLNGELLEDDFATLWRWPGELATTGRPHDARFRTAAPFKDRPRLAAAAVPEHVLAKAGPTERDDADELAIYMARKALGLTA